MPSGTGAVGVPMFSWVLQILPYIDNQDMFDQWSMFTAAGVPIPYLDGATGTPIATLTTGQATNFKIGETAVGVLICPDDNTVQPGSGNLSYVVNGGFSLYHPLGLGWVGSPTDGAGTVSAPNTWSLAGTPAAGAALSVFQGTAAVLEKTGVMYLESTFPQGDSGRNYWNYRSTLANITDGSSATLLLSENVLTGVSSGSTNSLGFQTNWATPFPSFTMFIGPTDVCGVPSATAGVNCTVSPFPLQAGMPGTVTQDRDGAGWAKANFVGTYANINGGLNLGLTTEGGYPFSNSNHPGGLNMGFCDGAVRFVTSSIDGTVYSKMITSAGQKLPTYAKQLPLSQDAFAPQ
jgi:prepilin-type processing-associated H-X9-DG protein